MNRFREGLTVLRNHGVWSVTWQTRAHLGVWTAAWNTVTSRYPIGMNIFEADWDLLVILDTCRVDALRTMVPERPWLDAVERRRSVGSMSAEFMLNTFRDEHRLAVSNTAFVSRNVWSQRILDERFHERTDHEYELIHDGWPAWNPLSGADIGYHERVDPIDEQDDKLHPEHGHIPHVLTDRAIAVGRETDCDRLLVHYNVPHLKYIADALAWESGETPLKTLMDGPEPTRDLRPEERSYDPVQRGDVSPETVRTAYRQNLRLALDYVGVLLQNVDADDVVITADHGELLGEHGFWGHPFAYPFGPVKSVPWARTTAADERTYEPVHEPLRRRPDEEEQRELLRSMGYL